VSAEESRQAEAKLQTFGSQVDAVRIAWGRSFVWFRKVLAAGAVCKGDQPTAEGAKGGSDFVWNAGGSWSFCLRFGRTSINRRWILTGTTQIAELPALLSRCTAFLGK